MKKFKKLMISTLVITLLLSLLVPIASAAIPAFRHTGNAPAPPGSRLRSEFQGRNPPSEKFSVNITAQIITMDTNGRTVTDSGRARLIAVFPGNTETVYSGFLNGTGVGHTFAMFGGRV